MTGVYSLLESGVRQLHPLHKRKGQGSATYGRQFGRIGHQRVYLADHDWAIPCGGEKERRSAPVAAIATLLPIEP